MKGNSRDCFEKFYDAEGDDVAFLGMSPEEYEKVHEKRFNDTVKLFRLDEIKNKSICDLGCGPGGILNMCDNSNKKVGMDGYDFNDKNLKGYLELPFDFYQADFDYDRFSNKTDIKFDALMSFETLEHLCNPYNFFFESKKMLLKGGIFYLTFPQIDMQHNTFYPSLMYHKPSFDEFLGQMAFGILHHSRMNTRYGGLNCYILKNLHWDNVKMKFVKTIEKFKGQPPHIQINL